MKIVPITFRDACAFVDQHHRHHRRPQDHKFSVAAEHEGRIVGVAIVGRPVSRHLDDGRTLEVTRLCTLDVPNAASKLYSAARRAAAALGYKRCITYTLQSESGVSLRAAGWTEDAASAGGSWSRPGRIREDDHPLEPNRRWLVAA